MTQRRALVTGGYARKALQAARSLSRLGLEVTVACHQRTGVALWSRVTSRRLLHPDPEKDPAGFRKFILRELRERPYSVVMPTGGADTAALAAARDELEPLAPVAAPPAHLVSLARDRVRFLRLLERAGLGVPRTLVAQDEADLRSMVREIGFPLIVRTLSEGGGTGIHRVDGIRGLSLVSRRLAGRWPLLVQEFVGDGRPPDCVTTVVDEGGRLLFVFAYEVLRTFPRRHGASTLVRSIAPGDLERVMRSVVEATGWRGVAHLDVIRHHDGTLRVIELNPRLWAPLGLAIDCGVDVPAILYRLAVGLPVEPIDRYSIGRMRRWLLPADLLWLITGLGKSDTIRDFLSLGRSARLELISLSDPGPAMAQVLWMARHSLAPDLWRRILDRT